MTNKEKEFKNYLEELVSYYQKGIMCSLHESVVGEHVSREILNTFIEMFEDVKDE